MARLMKHWWALVAIGCGLVALWLLPLDPPQRVRNYLPPTEAQALKVKLVNEARLLNDVLKRTHWLDSLSDVLANAEPDENGVLLSLPEGPFFTGTVIAEVRAQVAQEIDLLKIESSKYRFAVASPNAFSGNHESFGRSSSTGSKEFYTLEVEDRMVCLMLNPRSSNNLGPCAFFLIHGRPGPAVRSWLSQGGAQFATRYAESRNPFAGLGPMERLFIKVGNQGLFGMRAAFSGTPSVHRCLAGNEHACRKAALEVERPSRYKFGRDLPAFLHKVAGVSPFYTYEESLFYDLEQEFGRVAFGRFWTSDQDVDTAFQAAFGLPIGQWVLGWAQARLGVYHMGPLPSLTAIILSLGVISFFLTIAIAMGTRRKVA